VSVDAFPGREFDAWVGFVSPVAEFTPKNVETPELRTSLMYEVRVFFNDPRDLLRLGMPATVRLRPDRPGTPTTRPSI
jgi:HlyD family secretion protein